MDNAYKIFEYLPLKYKIASDFSYFDNLKNSVERNYNEGDYHFALAGLHMIYMGIVYHYLYRLHRSSPGRFDLMLIGFHNFLKKDENGEITWHSFCPIHESSIFDFYRSVGVKKDVIGILKKPVKSRNELMHTNGIYVSSENDFSDRSLNYLQCMEKIENFCNDILQKIFKRYLRSLKISLEDEEEAKDYILNDLVPEYGINQTQLVKLLKIKQIDYATTKRNAKFIQRALKEIVFK